MENANTGIGRRIYDLRIERDIQQGELANAVHIHQSVLNRIEKGSRPARDTEIRDIALYFDVSADMLLGLPHSLNSSHSVSHSTGNSSKLSISIGSNAHAENISCSISDSTAPSNADLQLSEEEKHLISQFRKLDTRGKTAINDTMLREVSYSNIITDK